ncbi:MAG: methylated-DNA--[protein]-cysteine S-methyltransferase [Bifidobacteriaceae bacterium]|jgi:O-6-methylguanine DNA methyltransferase|nr:methylated-DNA--[protein]-cysteine S-methyltransferase [Bifidobacteriaceae bacterium]
MGRERGIGADRVRELASAIVDTPAGDMAMVFDVDDATVYAAGFQPVTNLVMRVTSRYAWHGHATSLPHTLAEAFEAYGDGQIEALDGIVGVQPGAEFRQRVWRTLRQQHVPLSYGALADLVGVPRAARAVGTACATNLLGLIVPCHRVIRADGALGHYGYGVDVKRRLLAHEARHADAP